MKRGFTLIELLIVIAILAVLATVVVLVLNPAELLKQARDSTRISDLNALNSAIALVIADNPSLNWVSTSTCAVGTTGTSTTPIASTTVQGLSDPSWCVLNSSQANTGTGWVPVNFTTVTGGAPLSKLPLDPVNSTSSAACSSDSSPLGCFYAYKSSSSTPGIYEIDANMESTKYGKNGPNDVESKDGGNRPDWYEVGSSLVL
jgi:prepilin-type N-terminal cleavage/methylation domain-containing protein